MLQYVAMLHTRDEDSVSASIVDADSCVEAFEELGRKMGHNVPAAPNEFDWQDFIVRITVDGRSTREDFCRIPGVVKTKSWDYDVRGLYIVELPTGFVVNDSTYIVAVTTPHGGGLASEAKMVGVHVVRALSPRDAFETSDIPYDKDKDEGYVLTAAGRLVLGGHWQGTEMI